MCLYVRMYVYVCMHMYVYRCVAYECMYVCMYV
jgi:hypothetical protein